MSVIQDIFRRYTQQKATNEEQQLVDGWYSFYEKDADPVLQAEDITRIERTIWQKIQAVAPGQGMVIDMPREEKQDLAPGVSMPMQEGCQRKALISNLWRYAAAVAVVLLITAGAWWFMMPDKKQSLPVMAMITAGDKMKSFYLPDSTHVVLNTTSTLQWDDQYNATDRRVVLQGEGYFEVHKDKQRPFVVESKGVFTKALGTAFNIEAYEKESEVRVALIAGSVEVTHQQQAFDAARLQPGQLLRYNSHDTSMLVQNITAGNATVWTTGGMSFYAIPLTEALDRLSHRYGIAIQYDQQQLKGKTVSGSFKSLPWQQLLPNILFTHNLHYELKDSHIRVY